MTALSGVVGPLILLAFVALIVLQHRRITRDDREDRD
jgi:hypothetical protein